jgi:Protein of unknown function DUF72
MGVRVRGLVEVKPGTAPMEGDLGLRVVYVALAGCGAARAAERRINKSSARNGHTARQMEGDLPQGVLRQGTCGYTAPRGSWDPPAAQRKTSQDKLAYYARRLPCVEVDGTTYRCPTAEQTQAWVSATPPGFAFCVKAFGPLTTRACEIEKLPRAVRTCLGAGGRGGRRARAWQERAV